MAYQKLMSWCGEKKVKKITENVMMVLYMEMVEVRNIIFDIWQLKSNM